MTVLYLSKTRAERLPRKTPEILITDGVNFRRIRLDSVNDSSEISTLKNGQPKDAAPESSDVR